MKTSYVDVATGERHLLVRTASSGVAMTAMSASVDEQRELLALMLRNQQVIMRALEDVAKPANRDALREHVQQTEARLTKPPAKAAA